MKLLVLAAVCGAFALPSISSAADVTAAPAPQAAGNHTAPAATTADAAKPKKEKRICKQIGETGSRLGAKAVCKTAQEWEEESAAQRRQSDVDLRPR